MQTQEIKLDSKKATQELARKVARNLVKGSVLALYGQLGTGKTFFTQKLCKILGISEIVSSPSYVLMNEYKAKLPIFHLDLYRLTSLDEVLELGLEELFESGITIIEWPEVAEEMLPPNTIRIKFDLQGYNRTAFIF
jgi:tRNA threonylcarbamoyladenosine biosynthesis protein TsaE